VQHHQRALCSRWSENWRLRTKHGDRPAVKVARCRMCGSSPRRITPCHCPHLLTSCGLLPKISGNLLPKIPIYPNAHMTRFSGEVWFHPPRYVKLTRYTHACCRKSPCHSREVHIECGWRGGGALWFTRVTGPSGSQHRRLPRHCPTVCESDEWLGVSMRDTKLMTGAEVNKIYNTEARAHTFICACTEACSSALQMSATFKTFRFHGCNYLYILILWFNLQLWLRMNIHISRSLDSSVSTATRRRNRSSTPGRNRAIYFLHSGQTGSGSHPALH
jgi:hypothetical protein